MKKIFRISIAILLLTFSSIQAESPAFNNITDDSVNLDSQGVEDNTEIIDDTEYLNLNEEINTFDSESNLRTPMMWKAIKTDQKYGNVCHIYRCPIGYENLGNLGDYNENGISPYCIPGGTGERLFPDFITGEYAGDTHHVKSGFWIHRCAAGWVNLTSGDEYGRSPYCIKTVGSDIFIDRAMAADHFYKGRHWFYKCPGNLLNIQSGATKGLDHICIQD